MSSKAIFQARRPTHLQAVFGTNKAAARYCRTDPSGIVIG
jgi:hypothetical protein